MIGCRSHSIGLFFFSAKKEAFWFVLFHSLLSYVNAPKIKPFRYILIVHVERLYPLHLHLMPFFDELP